MKRLLMLGAWLTLLFPMTTHADTSSKTSSLVLGGGCFWCTEAAYELLPGVKAVVSGYTGGQVENPTYAAVCEGTTGHAEVIRIDYDPAEISLERLLDFFWQIHDPTTLNRQGNDVGTQYRSGIYYGDALQAEVAREVIAELAPEAGGAIVTEVLPLQSYWPAEDYHQDYFRQHPEQGYCAFVVSPKVQKFRKSFSQWMKPGA